MNVIELMALVVIVLGVVKLFCILISPKSWLAVVKVIYSNTILTILISLILASISLWYLVQELTIIQIFAAMFFFMFLILLSFAVYGKDTISWAEKMFKKKDFLKRSWLPILIWVILLGWAIYKLSI